MLKLIFFPYLLLATINEYQDNPGGKGGRFVGLTTYHLHVPIVKKSGDLNLLEPCGPVQDCNGTALLLPLASHTMYSFTRTIKQSTILNPLMNSFLNKLQGKELVLKELLNFTPGFNEAQSYINLLTGLYCLSLSIAS